VLKVKRSGALHVNAVASGMASSLELLDADAGVRAVADRLFLEDRFSKVRGNLRTIDPGGPSEPMVFSRLEARGFGPDHVLHLDPFAFVMAPEDAQMRAVYRDLICECDAIRRGRVQTDTLVFADARRAADFPEVLEKVRALDEMRRTAALYQTHSEPQPGVELLAQIQKIFRD